MLSVAFVIVVLLTCYNLGRMTAYLVGTDIFAIREHRRITTDYHPTVTLIAPVHNEALVVERTMASLLEIEYEPLQIILADDGSTDDTLYLAWLFKIRNLDDRIQIFTQRNGGKAHVLNSAITELATGELVMCLDGDSTIAPDAVGRSVALFADPRTEATASNVQIMPGRSLLNFVQRFEYLVNHNMKKAQSAYNLEYIIGGIGSTFRRSTLDEVGYYDTNTMTEDIDLTLKIFAAKGNRDHRAVFAADSFVYTEACPTWRSLIRQRTRWKYGRMQAFYKQRQLFFSRQRRLTRWLSWFALPNVLLQEAIGVLEPLMLMLVVAVGFIYNDPSTILLAVFLMTAFNAVNILGNTQLPWRVRLPMAAAALPMYLGFYAITVVEYFALIHLIREFRRIPESVAEDKVTWVSPERVGGGIPCSAARDPLLPAVRPTRRGHQIDEQPDGTQPQ